MRASKAPGWPVAVRQRLGDSFVLLAVSAVLMSICVGCTAGPAAAPPPPKPNLAQLIPATEKVTGQHSVQLTSSGPAQVVVTDEGAQPNSSGSTSRDLVILSWDAFAKRWVVVFDAANVIAPGSAATNLAQDAVLPSGANYFGFGYAPIAAAPGETDVELWANYNFGANDFLSVYVIHYDGQSGTIAYSKNGVPGVGGTPTVLGRAPHQTLRVHWAWLTDADPECCAVRTYVDTVTFQKQSRSGAPPLQAAYRVISTTQSWLGVFVALEPSASSGAPPDPIVLSVVQGGPAEGLLQPGDQLVGVAGVSAPVSSDLGPPVIDEAALSLPGKPIALTIVRAGAQRVVNLTMGSTASPAYAAASAPEPGYLGAEVSTGTPQVVDQYGVLTAKGVQIASVESGGPAAAAGLASGDVITSIGSTPVGSIEDLEAATGLTPPGTTVQIAYIDSTGIAHTTNLTMGVFPTDTPGPPVTGM